MPRISCLTCKKSAHATLSETGWEGFPGGWLVRTSNGLAELVCSMTCADERDRALTKGPYRTPAKAEPTPPIRPSWCTAYLGGQCCECNKTHSSNTCCAHDEQVVPR